MVRKKLMWLWLVATSLVPTVAIILRDLEDCSSGEIELVQDPCTVIKLASRCVILQTKIVDWRCVSSWKLTEIVACDSTLDLCVGLPPITMDTRCTCATWDLGARIKVTTAMTSLHSTAHEFASSRTVEPSKMTTVMTTSTARVVWSSATSTTTTRASFVTSSPTTTTERASAALPTPRIDVMEHMTTGRVAEPTRHASSAVPETANGGGVTMEAPLTSLSGTSSTPVTPAVSRDRQLSSSLFSSMAVTPRELPDVRLVLQYAEGTEKRRKIASPKLPEDQVQQNGSSSMKQSEDEAEFHGTKISIVLESHALAIAVGILVLLGILLFMGCFTWAGVCCGKRIERKRQQSMPPNSTPSETSCSCRLKSQGMDSSRNVAVSPSFVSCPASFVKPIDKNESVPTTSAQPTESYSSVKVFSQPAKTSTPKNWQKPVSPIQHTPTRQTKSVDRKQTNKRAEFSNNFIDGDSTLCTPGSTSMAPLLTSVLVHASSSPVVHLDIPEDLVTEQTETKESLKTQNGPR